MGIIRFRRVGYYLSIILVGLGWMSVSPAGPAGALEAAQSVSDPVIAAAGDIACDPSSSSFNGGNGTSGACRQRYTSDLLVNGGFAAILPLGDNQYYCGGYQAWLQSYDLSWGRVKSITRPSVGNHEYLTSGGTDCNNANSGADGYFRYFGTAAGQKGQGYYSYNIGAWHLIALNSNCSSAGGCASSSAQGQWLQADLAANRNLCTLAYWHIPLFSSGGRANSNTQPLWQILYNNNVELVLNGHDHIYERFAPQTPNGTQDTARGIRQFIVGTGGSNHTSLASIAANSLVRNTDTFGILKLTLHSNSYDWQFVPEPGKTFADSGAAPCFGNGQIIPPTSSPTPTISLIPTSSPVSTGSPIPTGEPVPTLTNTASSATPPSNPGPTITTTFSPIADAYVNESSPTTNYGTSTQLRTDGSPLVRSYMRFDVRSLVGRATRATLRVYASSALSVGYDVRAVTGGTWGETTINFNNAPTFGSAIGASGPVIAGGWTTVDMTSIITANGVYDIVLTTASGTALSLASREAAAASQPQLIVEAQTNPIATPTATITSTTTTPTPSPTATASKTSTFTLVPSQTAIATLTATLLSSSTGTMTSTASITPSQTATPTFANPSTSTPTFTSLASDTPTLMQSETPISTSPVSETAIVTETLAGSETPITTVVPTDTPVPTVIDTETPFPARTDTQVPTGTATTLPTPTLAPSATSTPMQTPTRTSTAVASQTSAIQTITITAAADAYVDQSNPTINYGASNQVRVDGSPLARSYLRFDVPNLTGRITRATLRIYANSSSNVGYDIRLVTSTWSETSITYNNAPPFGSAISASSPFSGGQWITVDITSVITGNGTYNLALTTASSTAISLASRESGANAPQLIIETGP